MQILSHQRKIPLVIEKRELIFNEMDNSLKKKFHLFLKLIYYSSIPEYLII